MSDKQQGISRRDFIKMAGIGLAALTYDPNIQEKVIEPLVSSKEKIVTEDATFYPTYERHNNHPDMSQKIREVDSRPLIYFRECIVKPGFIRNTNQVILTTPYFAMDGSGIKLGTLLTSNEISTMYESNSSMSLEGLVFDPKKAREDFEKANKDFYLHGTIAAITTSSNLINKLKGKEISDKDLVENVASLLALGWSSGYRLEQIVAELDKLPSNYSVDKVKNALNNISAFTSHLHPENMTIFFRNLYGARKMQMLARHMKSYDKDSNPGIVFCYGNLHRGINDLLTLGPDITLSGFSVYSDATLREIVNNNGGIKEFCKTLVIPIKGVDLNASNEKQFIFDTELMDYLEKRLGSKLDKKAFHS